MYLYFAMKQNSYSRYFTHKYYQLYLNDKSSPEDNSCVFDDTIHWPALFKSDSEWKMVSTTAGSFVHTATVQSSS
jgi:hypothetical protein